MRLPTSGKRGAGGHRGKAVFFSRSKLTLAGGAATSLAPKRRLIHLLGSVGQILHEVVVWIGTRPSARLSVIRKFGSASLAPVTLPNVAQAM
jgi:hypothetical protein